jgi:hypothetical protein
MADRRRVGKRSRSSDDSESRLAALRRRVSKLRGDDSPDGVDARTRGDDRSAVDARRVDVDETAAADASGGDFEGVPTADGSKPRSRVARAKQQAIEELRERADSGSLAEGAKKALESVAADEGAPSRAPGTTGTQTEEIAKRATDAAAVRAPMGGSLRTVGDERVVTEMARAGAAEGAGLLSGAPLAFGTEGRRPRGRAPPVAAVGMGVSGSMTRDDAAPMGFEDPFGLAGDVDDQGDRDDEGDAGAFPGLSLPGGEG